MWIFVSALLIPSFVIAHGSGDVVPAPVPVTIAVFAGLLAVLLTFFFTLMWEHTAEVKHTRIHMPRSSRKVFFIGAATLFTILYSYDVLAFAFWAFIVPWGVFLTVLISTEDSSQSARDSKRIYASWSLAPFFLCGLFLFEFFMPASNTSQGIMSVLLLYSVFMIVGRYVDSDFLLRHELLHRTKRLLRGVHHVRLVESRNAHPARVGTMYDTEILLLAVLITATSFDGLMHSSYWSVFSEVLGESALISGALFIVCTGCFLLLYTITIALMHDDVHEKTSLTRSDFMRLFVPAFVPIAVGYLIAHNITRVTFLFTPEYITYAWTFQIACIIIGHVWATIISHRIALATLVDATVARRSQYGMLVCMLIVTAVSIFMLQAPL